MLKSRLIYVAFVVSSFLFEQSSFGMRVGFEFQLEGSLCSPWSLHQSLQKREIFCCEWNSRKLWHIELDGTDIEYVTEPHALQDTDTIKLCINSILEANKKLVEVVTRVDEHENASIGYWYDIFSQSYRKDGICICALPFLDGIKSQEIKQIPNWEPRWQPQLTIQHQLSKTIPLCRCLFRESAVISEIVEKDTPNSLALNEKSSIAGLVFLQNHALQGIKRSFDSPLNEDTVFLKHVAVAVCQVRNDVGENRSLPDLLKDKKVVDLVNNPQLCAVISNPMYALLRPSLLGYLELSRSPQVKSLLSELSSRKDGYVDSLLLMHKTLQDYNFAHQFDAKRWTHFMSRRPFSIMYQDIINSQDHASLAAVHSYETYVDLFNKSVKVASFSLRTNYAEQFYDKNLDIMNLEWLVHYFPIELQGDLLSSVLKEGLLSSCMLSCMNVEKAIADKVISSELGDMVKLIGNDAVFYNKVLSSVQSPEKACFLSIEKHEEVFRLNVEHRDSLTDAMSPLFPLDLDDSMGRYKEASAQLEVSTYGSAVVEFRSIQYVKNPQHEGDMVFLTDPLFLDNDVGYLRELLQSL